MSYVPNFIPSDEPCVIPTFVEKRGRLLKNGLFFRSLNQGTQSNSISVAVFLGGINTAGSIVSQSITIKVYVDQAEVESFIAHQTKSTTDVGTENDHFHSTGFVNIRQQINGISTLIEMPARAFDVEDVVSVDPNNVVGFEKTNLTGASGGPNDGSDIDSIRTGPEATLIGIKSTENETGQNVDPSLANRIKKWDGSNWIPAQ